MIKPASDRLDYAEQLKPPFDYSLNFAVACTYSLNLQTLTASLFPLTKQMDADGCCTKDPVCILAELQAIQTKLIVFCDNANIQTSGMENHNTKLFPLLDSMIFPVFLKAASFHPKMWLLKFQSQDTKEVCYRIIILSKNLTFDRSWDMAFSMDGIRKNKKNANAQPIADFLRYLCTATNRENKKKLKRIQALAKELESVCFENRNCCNVHFFPLYNDKSRLLFRQTSLFAKQHHSLLVISPFLSSSKVYELFRQTCPNGDNILISRTDVLNGLNIQNLPDTIKIYQMSEKIVNGEHCLEDNNEISRQDIHAKLYVAETGKRNPTDVFFGSMNLTSHGLNNNVELMVCFSLPGKNVFQSIKKDLRLDLEKSPFELFIPQQNEIPEKNPEEEELKAVFHKLLLCSFSTTVRQKRNLFQIDLTCKSLPDVPSEVSVMIKPLMGSESKRLSGHISFSPLPLKKISDIYQIHLKKNETEFSSCLIVETVKELAESRNQEIINECVNLDNLVKYIEYTLSEKNEFSIRSVKISNSDGKNVKSYSIQPVIYEKMLKCAVSDKEKLKNLLQTIKRLKVINDTANKKNLLELCQLFLEAVKK